MKFKLFGRHGDWVLEQLDITLKSQATWRFTKYPSRGHTKFEVQVFPVEVFKNNNHYTALLRDRSFDFKRVNERVWYSVNDDPDYKMFLVDVSADPAEPQA